MSTYIHAVAQVIVSQEHLDKVNLYNGLIEGKFTPPDDLIDSLKSSLGENVCEEWGDAKIKMDEHDLDVTVECGIKSRGDAFYGGGMIINIADLPQDTVSLKICAES